MKSNKIILRKNYIQNRIKKTIEEKEYAKNSILKQLKSNKQFINANIIGMYNPIFYEIDLMDLLKLYPNKTFCFPKIVDNEMFFVKYDENTKFIKTKYGVNEPDGSIDISEKIEVFLVPAVGMTKTNYRLGHGKGYYDKFFKIYHNNYKIGIIYRNEEVFFEPEKHDIALNAYIKGE